MPIQLNISPRIIPNIATLYNDVNRIFMEYIDNSLDSAEEFYNSNLNAYSKKIEIKLTISGKNHKDGKVMIKDNCCGIHNFTKVVRSIGDSDKKAQPWTSGQFGYGIYSFMAAAEKLEIISKTENSDAIYIPIDKQKFEATNQKDVFFPDPVVVDLDTSSGTQVCLQGFDRHTWKQLKIDELKSEINKHFEILLGRDNLKIYIIDNEGNCFRCKPYDYEDYEGETYRETITELHTFKGRKYVQHFDFELKVPIKVFLKLTKGKILDKPPVFIIKGRRIGSVKDIRAFKSTHKNDIWGHPNLTGYIDLADFLEPTLARNDFRNNLKSKALFNKLMELEPLILEFIKDINKRSEDKHYKELENYLNVALSRLARIDSMSYRKEYLSGNDVNLETGGLGQSLSENGDGSKDRGKLPSNHGNGEEFGENEGNGLGIIDTPGEIPGGSEGEGAMNKESDNPFEDSEFKGSEKRKSGFDVRIVDRDPDVNALTNQKERSRLVENTIEIFKKHPEFESRVFRNRKGEQIITQKLTTYLAGEITVHYKDKFHSRKGQPEYGKYLFSDLVNFIYNFENSLSNLVDKNLSDI